jgi:hypothetical protein
MDTEVIDGWRYNTTDPTGITGSFDGTFDSTQLVYGGEMVTGGDTFGVHLVFDKALWDGTDWSDSYAGSDYGKYSDFGAPVPEPATMALLGFGGLGMLIRRRRTAR